jgi:hypothetical protein
MNERNVPKELKLKLLTQITSGLLASGNFTTNDGLRTDNEGKTFAVSAATYVFSDILEAIGDL